MSFRRAWENTGQFAKAGFVFHKAGEWDACGIALNQLAGAGAEIADAMDELAQIVVDAVNDTKESGDFVANSPITVRLKGSSTPWVDGTQDRTTGEAVAMSAGRGGYIIMLSGDQQVVSWVDGGTSKAPARPLFQKAWERCEADVKARANEILERAVGE